MRRSLRQRTLCFLDGSARFGRAAAHASVLGYPQLAASPGCQRLRGGARDGINGNSTPTKTPAENPATWITF